MAKRYLAGMEEQVSQGALRKLLLPQTRGELGGKETTCEGIFSYVLSHLTASQSHSLMLRTWSVAMKSWQNDWFARLSDHSFDFMVSIMTMNRQEAI